MPKKWELLIIFTNTKQIIFCELGVTTFHEQLIALYIVFQN